MVTFNISSCTSQTSTSIITSNINQPPPPPPPSTLAAGGRTLDRHNPIITDEKRSGISSKPQQKPKPNNTSNVIKLNNTTTTTTTKSTTTPSNERHENGHQHRQRHRGKAQVVVGMKSGFCKPSEMIVKAGSCNTSKPGVDYISPQHESSSRYLLEDNNNSNILDVDSSDNSTTSALSGVSKSVEVVSKFDATNSKPSFGSSHQVVLLRVSLHCRGCERKLHKHLLTMPGVTSFNIDFAAKKVTVTGDVTPLQVIASISKVKTAKFWSTTIPPPSHFNTSTNQVVTT